MFGSIGGPEMVVILIVALLVFGPRRLPALAKSLGQAMTELRRASQDFKTTLEREVLLSEGDKKGDESGSPLSGTLPQDTVAADSAPEVPAGESVESPSAVEARAPAAHRDPDPDGN